MTPAAEAAPFRLADDAAVPGHNPLPLHGLLPTSFFFPDAFVGKAVIPAVAIDEQQINLQVRQHVKQLFEATQFKERALRGKAVAKMKQAAQEMDKALKSSIVDAIDPIFDELHASRKRKQLEPDAESSDEPPNKKAKVASLSRLEEFVQHFITYCKMNGVARTHSSLASRKAFAFLLCVLSIRVYRCFARCLLLLDKTELRICCS
jgi:hypothetical protein